MLGAAVIIGDFVKALENQLCCFRAVIKARILPVLTGGYARAGILKKAAESFPLIYTVWSYFGKKTPRLLAGRFFLVAPGESKFIPGRGNPRWRAKNLSSQKDGLSTAPVIKLNKQSKKSNTGK